jgi:hypothetical protein
MPPTTGIVLPETREFLDTLVPLSKAGLKHPGLRFHTYGNHIMPSMQFLEGQWEWYEAHGVKLNHRATGAAVLLHDDGIAEPLDQEQHSSKEARTEEEVSPLLAEHGMEVDELDITSSGILVTNFEAKLCLRFPNDIVVVQADLHNTAGHYYDMAGNAHKIHKEDENLEDRHIPFDEHKQRVEYVLGKYFDRDMAIIEEDRLSGDGECWINFAGRQNLRRYLNETPESLGALLGIDPLYIA